MRTLIPFRLLTTRGESVKSTDTAQALWQTYCGGKSNLKEKLSSSFFLRVRLFTYTKNLLTRGGSVWAYNKTLLDEVGLITYSLLIPSWMIALHYAPYMANVPRSSLDNQTTFSVNPCRFDYDPNCGSRKPCIHDMCSSTNFEQVENCFLEVLNKIWTVHWNVDFCEAVVGSSVVLHCLPWLFNLDSKNFRLSVKLKDIFLSLSLSVCNTTIEFSLGAICSKIYATELIIWNNFLQWHAVRSCICFSKFNLFPSFMEPWKGGGSTLTRHKVVASSPFLIL